MICPTKSIKKQDDKSSSIDHAFALPKRAEQPEPTIWSPLTAGPYLVPVTRWIE